MTANDVLQIGLYVAVLLALTKPLGAFMARVYEGEPTFLDPVLGPVERVLYRAARVRPHEGMTWKAYAVAMLVFNAASLVVVYMIQRVQGVLPLDPQQLGAVSAARRSIRPRASRPTRTGRATPASRR
jgi:K+-transporting ATPase ATPase A chain